MTLEELKATLNKGCPKNEDGSRITFEQAKKRQLYENVNDIQPVHVDASIDEILALGFIPLDNALKMINKEDGD